MRIRVNRSHLLLMHTVKMLSSWHLITWRSSIKLQFIIQTPGMSFLPSNRLYSMWVYDQSLFDEVFIVLFQYKIYCRFRFRLLLRLAISDPTALCQLNSKFGCHPEKEARELLVAAAFRDISVVGISYVNISKLWIVSISSYSPF